MPLVLLSLAAGYVIQSDLPFVSHMFSDNMVLQRDMKDPIWGWSSPGDHLTVRVGGETETTTAGPDGRWQVKVGPFKAGGPYKVTVEGAHNVIFENVLFGDVWICSGQSNMEFGIGGTINAKEEVANANYPNIRLFMVPRKTSATPVISSAGDWKVCTPDTVSTDGGWNGFSAVGYFFGRKLHQDLNVPIGLIHTSWGGTPAEAWTEEGVLAQRVPDYAPTLKQLDVYRQGLTKDPYTPWYQRNDAGTSGPTPWSDPSFDDRTWPFTSVPNYFSKAGDAASVIWYRKVVDVPAEVAAKDTVLHFTADDNDVTWINGQKVGATDGYNVPRGYKLPAGTLKAGPNLIAIRVTDSFAPGGIYGGADSVSLEVTGGAPISLAGDWKAKQGAIITASDPFPMSLGDNPGVPTVLYNGMVEPIVPLAVKGAIWYQGESNADRAYQYRALLPAMIESWRKRFDQKFPFLIVQLAGFGPMTTKPGDDAWGELREAQYMTATNVPGVGIMTAIDIGNSTDIHPTNKQEVGRRLALVAESKVYHKSLEFSGPAYKSMKVEGGAIRIQFDHTHGGLKAADGGAVKGFAIAGDDHQWVWADAKIEGNSVVVSSAAVAHPVAVRYSWAGFLDSNLANGDGLPAFPFRTDTWKGITQK